MLFGDFFPAEGLYVFTGSVSGDMELFLIFTAKKGNGRLKHEQPDQNRAPIYEALEEFRNARVVPFDVPGHKHGKGNPELCDFLGK